MDNFLLDMAQAQNRERPAWAFVQAEIFGARPDLQAQMDPFFQNIRAFYLQYLLEA